MSDATAVVSIIPEVLELDRLGLLFVLLVAGLSTVLILGASATHLVFHYTILSLLFLTSTVGLVSAANVLVFYACWELASLFAWAIGRLGTDPDTTSYGPFNAASALGSFCVFVALLVQVLEIESLTLSALRPDAGIIATLIMTGIVLKSFGMLSDIWDRSGGPKFSLTGPTLVGNSLLVVGFYPYMRLLGRTGDSLADWHGQAGLALGGLAIIAALAALTQIDIRRVVSYAAFSQFTVLLFALSANLGGGSASWALFSIVGYSLTITGVAICASLAEEASEQRRIDQMGGLAQQMPLMAILFLACCLALVGVPPFHGFISGGLIALSLWSGDDLRLALIWSIVPALTLVYMARLFGRVCLGETRGASPVEPRRTAMAAVVVLLALLLAVGLAPDRLMDWIDPSTAYLAKPAL